jgi:hypothetical protein
MLWYKFQSRLTAVRLPGCLSYTKSGWREREATLYVHLFPFLYHKHLGENAIENKSHCLFAVMNACLSPWNNVKTHAAGHETSYMVPNSIQLSPLYPTLTLRGYQLTKPFIESEACYHKAQPLLLCSLRSKLPFILFRLALRASTCHMPQILVQINDMA